MITRPIQKIPNILIYRCPKPPLIIGYTYRHCGKPTLYRMIDTKSGSLVGEMIGQSVIHDNRVKQDFYPIKGPYKSFYIAELKIEEKLMGYGRKFIEFAKNISKQSGCNGRVHLLASRIYDRTQAPHVFYRKCGFTSNNDFMNKQLDNCIASNARLDIELADNLNMYLPIGDEVYKPKSKFQTFINFLKRFF